MDDGEGLRPQTLALEEYARGQAMEIEIVPGSEPGHGPIAGRPRSEKPFRGLKTRVEVPCDQRLSFEP